MRARNIKPGFFVNADLISLPPLARILFIGLWCLADREGRLEDRPMNIKFAVLPGDNCNVEKLLKDLETSHFISRYQSNDSCYIQVENFTKHQTPHIKERDSTIPAPDKHGANTIPAPPDCGLPDSGFTIVDSIDCAPSRGEVIISIFSFWQETFPRTAKMTLTKDRRSAINARLEEKISPETIRAAVLAAKNDPWWNGDQDGEWKADIKTICGKGSTIERLALGARKVTGPASHTPFKPPTDDEIAAIEQLADFGG